MTGQQIGLLFVEGLAPKRNGRVHWLCRCRCGKRIEVVGCQLRAGRKGCRSCANSKKIHRLPTELIKRLRAKGYAWKAIARVIGISPSVLYKRLGSDGRKNLPRTLRTDFERVQRLRKEGLTWDAIAKKIRWPRPWHELHQAVMYWAGSEARLEITRWVSSPHGRVRKAMAEGYGVGPGSERANVSGLTWNDLAKRELPRYIDLMFSIDVPRISEMLSRGASWLDIRVFTNAPVTYGHELREVYEARIEWDRNLERRSIENELL